jgi:hypothetical protein
MLFTNTGLKGKAWRTTGTIIDNLLTKTGLEGKYGKPLAPSYITISGVNAFVIY